MFSFRLLDNNESFWLTLNDTDSSNLNWVVSRPTTTTSEDIGKGYDFSAAAAAASATQELLPLNFVALGKWTDLQRHVYILVLRLVSGEENIVQMIPLRKEKRIVSIQNRFAHCKKNSQVLQGRTSNLNNTLNGFFEYVSPLIVWYYGTCSTFRDYILMNGFYNSNNKEIRTINRLKKNRGRVIELDKSETTLLNYKTVEPAMQRQKKEKENQEKNADLIISKIMNGMGCKIDLNNINSKNIQNRTQLKMKDVNIRNRRADQACSSDFGNVKGKSIGEVLEHLNISSIDKLQPDMLTRDPIIMANYIAHMQKVDWKIMEDSQRDKLLLKEMKNSNVGVDIDSLISWTYCLNKSTLQNIKSQGDSQLNVDLNMLMNFDSSYKRKFHQDNHIKIIPIVIAPLALQIVSFFKSNISARERGTRVLMDTSNIFDASKVPTIGNYKTLAEKKKLIMLSSSHMNSVEPFYSWIYSKSINISVVGRCMKEIAVALLILIKSSSWEIDANNIISNHPSQSNQFQINGGVWLYRLTWIYYRMLSPNNTGTYIEETYNGKKHGINVFTQEWKSFFQDQSNDDNNCSDLHAGILARNLENLSEGTHVESMLKMHTSKEFKSKIGLGLGMQVDAYYQLGDFYKKAYIAMNMDKNTNSTIDLYTFGGLPKELGGHTTTFPAGKTAPDINASESITLGRSQFYNNQYRNAVGEDKNKNNNGETFSASLQLNYSEVQHENAQTVKVSTNKMLDLLHSNIVYAVQNAHNFRNIGGFRLENAYIHSNWMSKDKVKNNSIYDIIKEVILEMKSYILSNAIVFDNNLISNYSVLNQGIYFHLYRCTVKSLSLAKTFYEKAAALLFLDQLTDYIKEFYHGKNKGEIKSDLLDLFNRNIIMATPSIVIDVFLNDFDKSMHISDAERLLCTKRLVEKEHMKSLLTEVNPFLLTKNICRSKASIRNDEVIEDMRNNGIFINQKNKRILRCMNCKTLCVNRAYLSTHLEMREDCKKISPDINEGMVDVTGSIVKKYIQQVLNTVEKRSKSHFAINNFLDGKSLYIQGDAGTGKSYLANKLMELSELLFLPSEQFVLAPTGLACYNSGPLCTTYHKGLGINGIELPSDDTDGYLMSKFASNKKVESKFKTSRVLFADEIGSTPAHYLITMEKGLRMAKKNDIAFGGVQLVIVGQAVQCAPIYNSIQNKLLHYPAGRACDISNLCVPIHLTKIMRSTGDEKYLNLSRIIRDGKVNLRDIQLIKTGGNLVNNMKKKIAFKQNDIMNIPRDNYTFKVYLNEVLYACHEWKDVLNRYEEIYNDILHPKSRSYFKPISVYAINYHDGLTTLNKRKESESSVRGNNCLLCLILYVGCSVTLQRNIGIQKKGARAIFTGVTDTVTSLTTTDANNLLLLEASINDVNNDPKRFVFNFNLEMKLAGRVFLEPIKLNRIDVYANLDSKAGSRKMFQLEILPGFVMTAQQLQGMTLNKLEIPMKSFHGEYLRNTPGYFYMMWTRVLNLDSILVEDIDSNIDRSMEFFNNQDGKSLVFERNWIEDAASVDDNVRLKYKDPVNLVNHLNKVFKESKNFKLIANSKKLNLLKDICLHILSASSLHSLKESYDLCITEVLLKWGIIDYVTDNIEDDIEIPSWLVAFINELDRSDITKKEKDKLFEKDSLETMVIEYLNAYQKKSLNTNARIQTKSISGSKSTIKPVHSTSSTKQSSSNKKSKLVNNSSSGRFNNSVIASYNNTSEIKGRPPGIVSTSKKERKENCIDSSTRKNKFLETNEADHQTAKKSKGNDINIVTDMKVNDHNPVQKHLEGTKKQLFVESDSDDDNLVIEPDSDDDNLVEC